MADKYKVVTYAAYVGVMGPDGLEIAATGHLAKQEAGVMVSALNRAYERGRADAHANLRTVLDL